MIRVFRHLDQILLPEIIDIIIEYYELGNLRFPPPSLSRSFPWDLREGERGNT